MQFGPVPVSAAKGTILVHSLRVDGRVLKKGRVLSDADIAVLSALGYREVTVARLDADDVAEDAAAGRVAAKLAGPHIRVGAAFTGRANLYAETRGIARIDADCIARLNAIDEAITVATLAPFATVEPRQMIATVKIIPFAAPRAAVKAAEDILARASIAVSPFLAKRVALISTKLAGTNTALLEKNRRALNARLEPFGSHIVHEARVAHETGPLSAAISDAARAQSELILIFGASAITDRRDVVPAAIASAGGTVTHLGMPVDPGNLLLLGEYRGLKIIGLPSCARSPKLNGFDFVLQRLLADIPVGAKEIAALSVGGLLSEIHTRPQPREGARSALEPKIAAVLLAAGLSSRMGHNKLTTDIAGKPLVRRAAGAALASHSSPVLIVTGQGAEDVETALADLPVTFVRNAEFRSGLSTSLIRGINALPDDCDGAIILLGDMPDVDAPLIDKLIAAFNPDEDRKICVATYGGKRGNPVLWSREFFPDIRKLEGDVGAKALIGENAELVCEVEAETAAPLVDIDTPAMLEAYRSRAR